MDKFGKKKPEKDKRRSKISREDLNKFAGSTKNKSKRKESLWLCGKRSFSNGNKPKRIGEKRAETLRIEASDYEKR